MRATSMAATTDALGHDLPAARQAMTQRADTGESELAWHDRRRAPSRPCPRYWMAAEQGHWDEALADARAVRRRAGGGQGQAAGLWPDAAGLIWPLEALALARTGDSPAPRR